MPTYSYQCTSCRYKVSVFQKMSDAKLENCDNCDKKNTLKRLISGGSGMVFKGSGFYLTDYTGYGKKPKEKEKEKKTNLDKKDKSTKKD